VTHPTEHRLVNPATLPRAVGFSHAVVAAPGRHVYLGGQVAQAADGTVVGETIVEQYEVAAANVARALAAAGARPEHLVQLLIYVTDLAAYLAGLEEIGAAHRRHLGRHYPACTLFEVKSLFVPGTLVELVGTAVVPGASS
jgi:enamine deaminase RidA (YjgF/YER057c/UK114 family)